MNTRSQRGFTMIELIVVIVILGVLAAVALPRLTNMQRDARVAALNAARGAVASASAMVHGSAMARQGQVQPACLPDVGFGANPPLIVAATGSGALCTEQGRVGVAALYPAATVAGVVAAAGLAQAAGTPTPATLALNNYSTAVVGTAIRIQVIGGPDPTTCAFTYTAPLAIGQAPVISANVTTGC